MKTNHFANKMIAGQQKPAQFRRHRFSVQIFLLFGIMHSPFFQVTLHGADKFVWRKFKEQCVGSHDKLVHVIGKIFGNTRQQVMHIAHLALTA